MTSNCIRGKTVALVSASASLINKRLGRKIDSFDYVVKFNGSVLIQHKKPFCIDYGSKDDIHFFNNPYLKFIKPNVLRYPYVKLFLCKFIRNRYLRFNKFESIEKSFDEVKTYLNGKEPYSGIAVLNHLVKKEPKKIELFGMDLYANQLSDVNEIDTYFPGYVPLKIKEISDSLEDHSCHSRYYSAVFLKNLLSKYSNIEYDNLFIDSLEKILDNKEIYHVE